MSLPHPHVLHWNGKDVPPELRSLKPGRYIVEALDESRALSDAEDAALAQGLDEIDRGDTVAGDEVQRDLEALLRKS